MLLTFQGMTALYPTDVSCHDMTPVTMTASRTNVYRTRSQSHAAGNMIGEQH
jgi:hypothetical protein